MAPRLFLLSPAKVNGLRGKQLTSPRAQFDAAVRYRSDDGVPIAEAFAFMSALYFRGKIAYARQFVRPTEAAGGGIFVITPGFGLVPPDWCITAERMKKLRGTEIDIAKSNYTKPLREHATAIARSLEQEAEAEVVLLGSVASGKYVDVLWPIFRHKLRFPSAFAGLGDMARGGLMLRAARANRELEYTTLDAPRHRAPGTSGKMPALPGPS